MTTPDSMWVDPERLDSLGGTYGEHAARWQLHLRNLEQLRARHAGSWGHDDMGQEFAKEFLKGMDSLELTVDAVRQNLEYVADGLTSGAQMYNDAEDSAEEAARALESGVEECAS